jgi:phosphoglycerate-specific signal transduction histidine kinase
MDDKEILERIREAIACLDEAAWATQMNTREQRKLHTRIQDAGDRLVEVREEIQARIQVKENLARLLKG